MKLKSPIERTIWKSGLPTSRDMTDPSTDREECARCICLLDGWLVSCLWPNVYSEARSQREMGKNPVCRMESSGVTRETNTPACSAFSLVLWQKCCLKNVLPSLQSDRFILSSTVLLTVFSRQTLFFFCKRYRNFKRPSYVNTYAISFSLPSSQE